MGSDREKRRVEERKRKSQKKEDTAARNVRKVAKLRFSNDLFVGREGRKVGSLAVGAEPSGRMRNQKLHAVVAPSTFSSQNLQNTPGPDHFWQFGCRKIVRRCGTKHISKPNKEVRTTFRGIYVQKLHGIVVGSTFRSQNVTIITGLDHHFWKIR